MVAGQDTRRQSIFLFSSKSRLVFAGGLATDDDPKSRQSKLLLIEGNLDPSNASAVCESEVMLQELTSLD